MKRRAALATLLAALVLPWPGGAATIQATVVPTRHEAHRGPVGRVGDVERVHWSVRDRFGRTIGTGIFYCRWVVQQARLCAGEIQLPLGKISVMGSSPTRELGVYSVVGGTGRYVGAEGEMFFRAIGFRKLVVSMSV